METKPVFISSCSRRELARRRPNRPLVRAELIMAVVVLLAMAAAAFAAVQGGL